MLAVVLFATVCGVYGPGLQSKAIDIIAGTRQRSLTQNLIFMAAAYMMYSGGQLLQGLLSARLSQRIVRQLRVELFEKIIDLPVRYLDEHSHGDVMSRMTNDIENISTTISQSLPSLFSGVLTIAGTAAVMVWYCWQLALLSCATVILTLTATKILSGKVRKFSRRRQMYLGQLNGTVEEMVSGYRTVVAYNHQDITTENFCRASDQLTRAGIRTDIFSGVMGPVMNCIGNIGFVIIAAFGGYFSINGMISVGVISAFIVYAKQFSRPINEIAQIYGQLQTAIAGAERVFMVLDEENEEKGGKSLAVGRDAGVLKGLPQGYDTMLTGSGENLSQGQRQLLAIARAFVADPKILILDEATSNVDTRTEKEIQDAMSRIMENRTSIVIAHRLSTIRDSDLIVVMDRGRIVEMGNHEELLEAMGKYYDLYMTQYAGFAT